MQDKRESIRKPGDVLYTDYMEPKGLTSTRLSLALRVHQQRILKILDGDLRITPEMALRLAAYFDATTAWDWMVLQAQYDLALAEAEWSETIAREVRSAGEALPIRDENHAKVLGLCHEKRRAKEHTARVVELGPEPTAEECEKLERLPEFERRVFDLILAGQKDPDLMVNKLDVPIGVLLAALTMLELERLVIRVFGGDYIRALGAEPEKPRRRRW